MTDASVNGRSQRWSDVGFVGLGRMGGAMAANLVAAGHRVVGYARRPADAVRLASLGVEIAAGIADLFECGIIVSMLPDDEAVREVALGRDERGAGSLAQGMGPGAIHLCMSTISTAMAARLTSEHHKRGQRYVAAPVFGNPDAARQRLLYVLAAGADDDLARCQPLFDSLGQKTLMVGAEPWHANLVKLLGNMMSATALEMISEAVAVFLKRGLDPKPFIDIMTGTMFSGRVHKLYGDKIVARSYEPGFVLPLVLKDVRLALAEAEAASSPMPSVSVVRDRLITGIARGYDNLDWTALGRVAEEEAGIAPVPSLALHPMPAE
ncbi:NAD(P)-dependent oxidoreductase [Phenylobacterium sp.]|uniref:NAD(P)-dependent oxidoreductase n=1 Tax=Phenylobacterium sp. TaxID=1871053 RepID=UPI001224C27E|nr:NAD(P)-dependent oxidoreductase [Phenylobacterium sp.]THD57503.1 MAG: NAD(P)-dependent oxidoreductase [Phenylobacterium sp.]